MSCREAEKAEINKRLREKNAAMVAKKKKGKDPKPTESSSSMPKTPQETIPKGPSVIVKRPCHVTDDVLAICDGPISKKTKSDDVLIPDLPDSSIVVASAASVAYGKKASSLLSHAEDQDTLVRFTGSACGSQSIAHLSQALKWSSAQVTKTKLYERQVKDLEKNVNDANKRATDHLMKLSDAEKEVAELKKELKDAEDRATTLKKTLADRDKEVQRANEAKMEAQTYWYAEGLKDRLDAVKKAGLDHKLCYIEGVDTLSDDEAIDSPTDQGDDDNNDPN